MQKPIIQSGGIPTHDGAVTRYDPPEHLGKAWHNPQRPVIFVNGMMNSNAVHAENALKLANTLGATVIGVYNETDSFHADLWQCITDKVKFANLQQPDQKVIVHGSWLNLAVAKLFGPLGLALPPRSDFHAWARFIDQMYEAARAEAPMLTKEAMVYELLGSNRATQELYKLLLAQPGGLLGAPIHAHSQGNLIVSNVLTAVALARGSAAIQGVEVYSYGSPAQGWPQGLNRVNNAFTFDPIGQLDLTMDWSSAKVGYKRAHGKNPLTHGFSYYADADAEFVVNRFRTGGWGMTLRLDKAGLAKFLDSWGDNIPRLRAVFDRLEKSNWMSSDDVALAYVNLKTDMQLAGLQNHGPELVAQLIRLMQAGYTSRAEQAAISRLKSAQDSAATASAGS